MSSEYIIRNEEVRANCLEELAALPLDKPWRVEIKPYRKKRSLAQNRLMWAYLEMVAGHVEEYAGMDRDDCHRWFKARFAPPKAIELNGEWAEDRSTTTLNTAEMTKYLDDIYRFCATELGLILPTPGAWEEHNGDLAEICEAMTERQ